MRTIISASSGWFVAMEKNQQYGTETEPIIAWEITDDGIDASDGKKLTVVPITLRGKAPGRSIRHERSTTSRIGYAPASDFVEIPWEELVEAQTASPPDDLESFTPSRHENAKQVHLDIKLAEPSAPKQVHLDIKLAKPSASKPAE